MPDLFRLHLLDWDDVSAEIVGRTIHIQYDSAERWDAGIVAGIGADRSTVTVYLQHGAKAGVMRDKNFSSVPDPTLYLLPE